MSEWEQAGPRAIRTAFDLINRQDERDQQQLHGDGPQMSG